MRNLIAFLFSLVVLVLGVITSGTVTATGTLFVLSYALDLPLFENIFIVVTMNILAIVFYSICALNYIYNSKK